MNIPLLTTTNNTEVYAQTENQCYEAELGGKDLMFDQQGNSIK